MSVTGWKMEARSAHNDDYGYVNIATTWKNKDMPVKPIPKTLTEVMWSHESVYGVIGPKVGDFIQNYGVNGAYQEGIFTHRKIAETLANLFSGLEINELQWRENPLEKTLKNGKPRVKKAKWLPETEVDLVHLYSTNYIDVKNPPPITTDFYTAIRKSELVDLTWFLCTEPTKEKIEKMNFKNVRLTFVEIAG